MTSGIEIVPELPDTNLSQRSSTDRFTSTLKKANPGNLPMNGVEHRVMWTQVPALMWPVLGRDAKSFWHLVIAVAVWITGTCAAVVWARTRHFQIK